MSGISLMLQKAIIFLCLYFLGCAATVLAAPAPELPGEEITESETALEKSEKQTKPIYKQKKSLKKNWRSPRIEEQLARDKTLIGMGYGALFVPTYSESRLEPEILVYKKMNKAAIEGLAGQRIMLEEGDYTVFIGSGNINQRMRYHVSIEEGHTTVMKPDWAGLIVETINPDNEYIREEYEIFELVSGIPLGKGYGLTEDRLKDIKTWILRPGFYRITRVGSDLTSLTNYITVQLNSGALTVVDLVFDEENGDLIAGGIKGLSASTRAFNNWQYGLRAGGNVNFFNKVKKKERSLTALGDFRIRAKFDDSRFIGLNTLRIRNSFVKEGGRPFTTKEDDLQFWSTWVRRINSWLGPYVRGKIGSHIFPRDYSEEDIAYIVKGGDTVRTLDSLENFELQPPLLPVELSEGLGINLNLINFYILELSTQLGSGAKQYLSRDLWILEESKDTTSKDVIKPDNLNSEFGIENIINARLRLGARFSVDFLSEVFFPLYPDFRLKQDEYYHYFKIDDFMVDFRFNLTRHIELSYIFEIEDRLAYGKDSPLRFEKLHNVLLRLSINI